MSIHSTRIYPVNNQILVRRQPTGEKRSAAGIYAPAAVERQTFQGEVLAVGPGRFVDFYSNPDYQLEPRVLTDHPGRYKDDRTEIQRQLVIAKHAPMPCKVGDVVLTTRTGTELEDDLWLFCDHEILAVIKGGN